MKQPDIVDSVAHQFEQVYATNRSLDEQVRKLKRAVEFQTQEINRYASSAFTLEESIQQLDRERAVLLGQNTVLRDHIAWVEQTSVEGASASADYAFYLERRLKAAEAGEYSWQCHAGQLSHQSAALHKRVAVLARQSYDDRKVIEDERAEIAKLRREIRSNAKQKRRSQKRLRALESQLAETVKSSTKLAADRVAIENRLRAINKKLQKKAERTKEELEVAVRVIEAYGTQLQDAEVKVQEMDGLRQTLEHKAEDERLLQRTLEVAVEEKAALQSRLASSQKEEEDLHRKVDF
ncbi:hypothetical protein F4821DRAFT_142620, partial [Hypoxylon rubiginosum]